VDFDSLWTKNKHMMKGRHKKHFEVPMMSSLSTFRKFPLVVSKCLLCTYATQEIRENLKDVKSAETRCQKLKLSFFKFTRSPDT
jgi:hypothetical protein